MASIKAPESIGGYYQAYASGDGGIRFTHTDAKGSADGERVPYAVAAGLTPEGHELRAFAGGELIAFRPVKRIAPNALETGGEKYHYLVTSEGEGWKTYNFFFYDESTKRQQELVNVSLRAALSFFLNHESECS